MGLYNATENLEPRDLEKGLPLNRMLEPAGEALDRMCRAFASKPLSNLDVGEKFIDKVMDSLCLSKEGLNAAGVTVTALMPAGRDSTLVRFEIRNESEAYYVEYCLGGYSTFHGKGTANLEEGSLIPGTDENGRQVEVSGRDVCVSDETPEAVVELINQRLKQLATSG